MHSSVVVIVVWRLVVPEPSRLWLPDTLARLASGPVAFVMPASAATELVALLLRCVLVAPVETAEADSATTMVTRSFTWLAFRSRPRSANCALGVQSDPTVGFWPSACWAASAAYLSSGEGSGPFFFFGSVARHVKTVHAIAIRTAANRFNFIGTPPLGKGNSPARVLCLLFRRGTAFRWWRCGQKRYHRDVRPILPSLPPLRQPRRYGLPP